MIVSSVSNFPDHKILLAEPSLDQRIETVLNVPVLVTTRVLILRCKPADRLATIFVKPLVEILPPVSPVVITPKLSST
jgi:hypothetical protein